ncbi:hypothetical protein FO519_004000 [Halicephalobus sp. NKZ332]|nr:hypothetical protein FO519_004000 [Halicephalobus sp. NKZ332]
MAAFAELGMMPELVDAVDAMGWNLPTDIQQDGIPAILGGADVCMAAETGSGKTGAFCLPILQIVWETMRDVKSGKRKAINLEEESWNLNIFDREPSFGMDKETIICESTHPKAWSGGRANKGVFGKGKYYYEAKIVQDGLCRVGWSTVEAALNLGSCPDGFGFGGTGKKSNANNFDDYGESFTLGDVIGCYLNLDKGAIHFSKNGVEFPTAFPIRQALINSTFYPAIVLKKSQLKLNFGDTPFDFPPKNGYVGVAQAPRENTEISPKRGFAGGKIEGKRPNNAPLCVIFEPTKELAEQTHQQISLFGKKLDAPKVRSALIVGGIPVKQQLDALDEGVDIITCTPGRTFDLIGQDKIRLTHVRFFILDEADGLVSGPSNCSKQLLNVYQQIPRFAPDGSVLQMIVCSATLHNEGVQRLAETVMHFPQWIDLKGQDVVPDTVHQVICMVDPVADKSWIRLRSKSGACVATDGIHSKDQIRPGSDNPETLSEGVKVLKGEYVLKAINHFKMDQCIIFCRTKLDCDHLEKFLRSQGIDFTCTCLHGDRPAAERTDNLAKFKQGDVRFLICTDVAARGIDVRGVPYVINMTLPPPEETACYVHRIGRVGRADRMGLAISLISTVPEKVWYHKCQNRYCSNAKLVNQGGCSIWYNEIQSLAEIEDHLGITINKVSTEFEVPVNEYDGKVVYGLKRNEEQVQFELTQAAVELSGKAQELFTLEREAQLSYWKLFS